MENKLDKVVEIIRKVNGNPDIGGRDSIRELVEFSDLNVEEFEDFCRDKIENNYVGNENLLKKFNENSVYDWELYEIYRYKKLVADSGSKKLCVERTPGKMVTGEWGLCIMYDSTPDIKVYFDEPKEVDYAVQGLLNDFIDCKNRHLKKIERNIESIKEDKLWAKSAKSALDRNI